MSYRKNGNNKAYENLKANPDVKKHMLEACIMADKEDSLVRNADGLGIRRIKKMRKKEHGEIFKKVAVASLSLAATGAIVAGVATYRNDKNKSNNSMAAKQITTEFKTTEKATEEKTDVEAQKDNLLECSIKLNKKGQKEFKALFWHYESGKEFEEGEGSVENSDYYAGKEYVVGDYAFRWNSTTDKCVYVRKKNEKKFEKTPIILTRLDELEEGNTLSDDFWTNGEIIIYQNESTKKIYIYNVETKEYKEAVIPESIKVKGVGDPSYIFKVKNGVMYIQEYDMKLEEENKKKNIFDTKTNLYVYDITNGECALLLEGGMLEDTLNDYVVIGEYIEDAEDIITSRKYSVKKITDKGLENIYSFDRGVDYEFIDEENNVFVFSTQKKSKASDGKEYFSPDEYIKFNVKTNEIVKEKVQN
ncbi:hypothetical protein [uncultured Eubacterium sp.]|uniref:hypothetical protein n=1 Tax=uncultured Eubacterium sp. TaxID=165185 RepID=UPI0025918A92|nr:hypothetical protein [uncultured Eubacterium sp.]